MAVQYPENGVRRCQRCGKMLKVLETRERHMDPMRSLSLRRQRYCAFCDISHWTREVLEADLEQLIRDSLTLRQLVKKAGEA